MVHYAAGSGIHTVAEDPKEIGSGPYSTRAAQLPTQTRIAWLELAKHHASAA